MSLAQNKKAYHDYEINDKISSGIELFGAEVKSVKSGGANLTGSKIILRGSEAFIVGLKITPYQINNLPKNWDPERTRKLLLKKSEIKKLYTLEETKKVLLIPLSLYLHNNFIKLEFAIGKKLNKHNKKEKIKERDLERNVKSEAEYFDEKY